MTPRWLTWLAPLVIAATLLAYMAWWGASGFVRTSLDTAFARKLGYTDAARLDRLTACSGIFGDCKRKIGFTTALSSEEFRNLVAQQGFKNFASDTPAEPMMGQGEFLPLALSGRNEGARFTNSEGRYEGFAPPAWWWMVRDGWGRTVTIYFYETAGKRYRFDDQTIVGNVVAIALKD